ncbi:hypothetical protein BH18ACI1_BH18ACI1_18030 [soil metagenome]
MSFYPPKINEKFQRPQNAGKVKGANAVGTSASFVCGAFVRVHLRIELKTKEIIDAKFNSNGCGFLIAAADILSEKIVGKRLVELHGLDKETLQTNIESELGRFPAHRKHCLALCLEALQPAFADFRAFQIEEFTGEKALICTCFGVAEETIENVIKANALETVEEVTKACNAGGGCGSCQPLIQEIIDEITTFG